MTGITVDQESVNRARAMLAGVRNGIPRALASTLNKTGNFSRTDAIRLMKAQVRLTSTYLRQRLGAPVDTIANKATFSNLVARVTTRQRGVLLSHFTSEGIEGPITRKKPKVKVKPTGRFETVGRRPGNASESFFIRLRFSGVRGIAQRRSIAGPQGGVIDVLYGPSLSQIYDDIIEDNIFLQNMSNKASDVLDNEVDRILARINTG